ncbi:MAG TPA: RluA family pseudouridine synthase [Ferruginibacter sp.]|nr:RluA family pseudouridine synthase [Ferruginibacter sp.]HMP20577.1 RluA family pseudouridine synthase [Ferruginibacter sp.]
MDIPGKPMTQKVSKQAIEIIFENDSFLAVNKAAGILTVPDRMQSETSLKDILAAKYGSIFTVHRLDRETSGIILFAKNEAAHKYFSTLFENRTVEKFYTALVHGTPSQRTGLIDAPIAEHPVHKGQMFVTRQGKASSTGYEVLETFGRYSLVKFLLHTGRTHQVRVHAKHIGHPVACDPLYGDGQPILLSTIKKKYKLSKTEEAEKPILSRVALHAHQLIFKDTEGSNFNLTAEFPKDIKALLQQLRKQNH